MGSQLIVPRQADGEWKIVGNDGGATTYTSDYGPYVSGGTFQVLRYRKLSSGLVVLQGALTKATAGASGDTAFTMPVGFRPPKIVRAWMAVTSGAGTPFDIEADGDVILRSAIGAGGLFSLNAVFGTL